MRMVSKIGEGSNAKVSKVRYRKQVAVLKMGRCARDQKPFEYEADLMAKVAGAGGVPQILAVAEDTPAMIMSYLPYLSLADAMGQ